MITVTHTIPPADVSEEDAARMVAACAAEHLRRYQLDPSLHHAESFYAGAWVGMAIEDATPQEVAAAIAQYDQEAS